MREATKNVQQVFIEGLLKALDTKLEENEHYLIQGAWESYEEGQSRVLVIKAIKELKQEFSDVYVSCFGE